MARLSQAQQSLLLSLIDWPQGRPVRTAHLSFAPLRRLVRRSFVRAAGMPDGWTRVSITDAGRAALSTLPPEAGLSSLRPEEGRPPTTPLAERENGEGGE